MKLNIKSISNIAKYAPHRVYALLFIGAAVLIPSIAIFAYGPERPTFTAENPASYVTFNSITNSPQYGDERNFVLVKDATNTSPGGFSDEINVQDGKEYLVRVLVHNNAAENLNLVAQNTKVTAGVPSTTGTSATIQASVSASNANPEKVWDEVTLKSDKRFNVAYVPGSSTYFNHDNLSQAFHLPDTITTADGALVGYDSMDGNLPGCNKFSGVAVFRVKIYSEKTPDFSVAKQVRKSGETGASSWKKSIAVNPSEKVDYLVTYKNIGQTNQDNVVVKDSLPAAISYVPGTTNLTNSANPNGLDAPDGITAPSGLNIGGYGPGGAGYTIFTGKVADEKNLPQCGNNILRNTATVQTENGSKSDYADVTVSKKCEDKPSYSCDLLQGTKIGPLEYSFNVNLSQNKALAKEVTIDFGDGQTATRDAKSLPVTHTYGQAGQYTVKATASFNVDGKTVKDVTSDACQVVINTETTPPATVAGTTPTSLPSTGPVEVFTGIIAAAALGLGVQQWIASRRSVTSAIHHQ